MFFDLLNAICKENGTSVTAVLLAVGLSKGCIRNWKNGIIPKYETRLKIANHLGIPVEKLMTKQEIEEQEKQKEQIDSLIENTAKLVSTPISEVDLDDISYAAYQELEGESESFKKDVLNYIKFKKSQKGND